MDTYRENRQLPNNTRQQGLLKSLAIWKFSLILWLLCPLLTVDCDALLCLFDILWWSLYSFTASLSWFLYPLKIIWERFLSSFWNTYLWLLRMKVYSQRRLFYKSTSNFWFQVLDTQSHLSWKPCRRDQRSTIRNLSKEIIIKRMAMFNLQNICSPVSYQSPSSSFHAAT